MPRCRNPSTVKYAGLSLISPTILTKRLNPVVDHGLVLKKKISGKQGYEYFPTESHKELLPVIKSPGVSGMRWSRNNSGSMEKA